MQFRSGEKKATKCLTKWIREGLGLHLEGGWDGLGRLLATFGRFLVVLGMFWISLLSSIGLRWGPEGLLDRFWKGSGKILGGFGEDLGRVWAGFGKIFFSFSANLGHVSLDHSASNVLIDVVKVETTRRKVWKRCISLISQAIIWIFWLFLDLQLLYLWLPHPHGWALTAVSPKNSGKIQTIVCEIGTMHLFQTFLFEVPTLTTHHF